jgi:hypothetical protein
MSGFGLVGYWIMRGCSRRAKPVANLRNQFDQCIFELSAGNLEDLDLRPRYQKVAIKDKLAMDRQMGAGRPGTHFPNPPRYHWNGPILPAIRHSSK